MPVVGSSLGQIWDMFASEHVCVAHMNTRGGAMKELHLPRV